MENRLLPIETLFLIHRDMQQQNQNYSKQIVLKLLGSRTVEPRTPKKGGTQVPYIILTFKRTFKGLALLVSWKESVVWEKPLLSSSGAFWKGQPVSLVTDRLFLQRRAPAAGAVRRATQQLQVQPPQQWVGLLQPSKNCSNWTFWLCSGCNCASHGCWPKPRWGPWIYPRAALPGTVTAQLKPVWAERLTNKFETTIPSNTERSPSGSQTHPLWALNLSGPSLVSTAIPLFPFAAKQNKAKLTQSQLVQNPRLESVTS